ncbi:MAG: PAS domain S-box protein [Opitutaceae bacterium]|nr:PAS domain S-box protein [Opitutaceae bacterium]
MSRPPRSLIRTTLLRAGIGGALAIAAITLVTYQLILRAMEERGLIHLEHYAAERARSEEARLDQIRENLQLAARRFVERYRAPDPEGFLDRFDRIFMRYPDGAVRNRPEHGDGRREANGWVNKHTELTPELKRRILVIYDTAQEFLPAWGDTFKSLYATSPEQINFGFDTTIPDWIYDTPADREQNLNESDIVSTQANNPQRLMRWAGPMIEPTYGDYLVALCLPVDIDGRHVATWCHDEPFANLIEARAREDIAGLTPMLVREDGRVIAHPHLRNAIVAADGQLFMRDVPSLASLEQAVRGHTTKHFSGYDSTLRVYYAGSRIEWSGWYFIVTQPRQVLTGQALRHAPWVLGAGLVAIVVFLVLHSATLRRSVARPLEQLTAAADRLGESGTATPIEVPDTDELGRMARAFNRMAAAIGTRDAALRELNADLERRISDRTLELQQSEARLLTMLDHAPEAIVVLDADSGRFTAGNDHALRLFGIDRAHLLGLGPVDMSPSAQADGLATDELARRHIASALAGGAPVFEWIHRRADGTTVPCEVRLRALPSRHGRLVIGTITDISERKRVEAAMLEALAHEREIGAIKSTIVSMVSHEFRTPLGVISSSAEILMRYLDRMSPDKRQEQLDAILRSTRRLGSLLDEVLLLGRFEAGRVPFEPVALDLPRLAASLVEEAASATRQACPIRLDLGDGLGGASGDEELLRHIAANLLANAVKYSPPGSPIDFGLHRAGADLLIEVRDRGIGIPPEDHPRLFTAFFRGGNVGQRPGTGLGLTIVRRCAELHGGTVVLGSAPGGGTIATVRLRMFTAGAMPGVPEGS